MDATAHTPRDRALSGVSWAFTAYVVNRAISLVTTAVLARLLRPDAFGLAALGLLIAGLITQLSSMGIAPWLVLRHDLTPNEERGALAVLATFGLGGAGVIALCALVLPAALDEPRLTEVLLVLAIPAAGSGIAAYFWAVYQRELLLRRHFSIQTAQSATFAVVALTLAIAGAGVWSIVIGQATGLIVYAGGLALTAPDRPRPAFRHARFGALARSGRGFLLQGGLTYIQQNADFFAVGRVLGTAQLGLYSLAFRLSEVPYSAFAEPVNQVSFSRLGRQRAANQPVDDSILGALRLTTAAAWPVAALLAATARPATEVLFGTAWTGMVSALQVLSLWAVARVVQGTIGWALNATGHSLVSARLYAIQLIILIPALIVTARIAGIEAVAGVVLADAVMMSCLLARLLARHERVPISAQWQALRPIAIATALTGAAAFGVTWGVGDSSQLEALIAGALCGALLYPVLLRTADPLLFERIRGLVGQALGALGVRSPRRREGC